MNYFDAFISHSSLDKIVLQVFSELERRGIKCWISYRDIPAGTPYARGIIQGIDASKYFLVFISPNSLQSEDVLNEIDYAHKKKKIIIPIYLEKITLSEEFAYYLNRHQWVNLYQDFEGAVNKLHNLISQQPSSTSAPIKPTAPKQAPLTNRPTSPTVTPPVSSPKPAPVSPPPVRKTAPPHSTPSPTVKPTVYIYDFLMIHGYDSNMAQSIYTRLEGRGCKIYLKGYSDPLSCSTPRDKIMEAKVILLIVDSSFELSFSKRLSNDCLNTLRYAYEHGCRIIPLLTEGIKSMPSVDGMTFKDYIIIDNIYSTDYVDRIISLIGK